MSCFSSKFASCGRQRHAGSSKTWLLQNPPVLNWGYWLTRTMAGRGVYPPRGHGAFPQDGRMGSLQFLIIMHLKCCADR